MVLVTGHEFLQVRACAIDPRREDRGRHSSPACQRRVKPGFELALPGDPSSRGARWHGGVRTAYREIPIPEGVMPERGATVRVYSRPRARSRRCLWDSSRSSVRSSPGRGSPSAPSAVQRIPGCSIRSFTRRRQAPTATPRPIGSPPPGTRPDVVLHLTVNSFGVRGRFLMAAVTMAHFPDDLALRKQAAMGRTRPAVPPGSGRPDCPRRAGWALRRRRRPDAPGPRRPRSGRGRPDPILRRAFGRRDARPFRGDHPGRVGRLRIPGAPPLERPGSGSRPWIASNDLGRRPSGRSGGCQLLRAGSGGRSKEAGRRRCDVYPGVVTEVLRSAAPMSPPGAPGPGVRPDGDRGGQPSGSRSWRSILGSDRAIEGSVNRGRPARDDPFTIHRPSAPPDSPGPWTVVKGGEGSPPLVLRQRHYRGRVTDGRTVSGARIPVRGATGSAMAPGEKGPHAMVAGSPGAILAAIVDGRGVRAPGPPRGTPMGRTGRPRPRTPDHDEHAGADRLGRAGGGRPLGSGRSSCYDQEDSTSPTDQGDLNA